MQDPRQFESGLALVTGIDYHVQGNPGFVGRPDPVADVPAVTVICRCRKAVTFGKGFVPSQFRAVGIFRKDVRIAHLLGVVVLVGYVWLQIPYSRPVGPVGIACP